MHLDHASRGRSFVSRRSNLAVPYQIGAPRTAMDMQSVK